MGPISVLIGPCLGVLFKEQSEFLENGVRQISRQGATMITSSSRSQNVPTQGSVGRLTASSIPAVNSNYHPVRPVNRIGSMSGLNTMSKPEPKPVANQGSQAAKPRMGAASKSSIPVANAAKPAGAPSAPQGLGTVTHSRINLAAGNRASARISDASASRLAPVSAVRIPKMLILAGALGSLAVVLAITLTVIWARHRTANSGQQAALDRLHVSGPKMLSDFQICAERLSSVRNAAEVCALLGQPDLKFKDKVPLWEPMTGLKYFYGPEFLAYYIKDENDSGSVDEKAVVNVFLFMDAGTKVDVMGPRKCAVLPASASTAH